MASSSERREEVSLVRVRYWPEDRVKRGAERRCVAAFRKARITRTGHVVVPVAPTFNFTDLLSWSVFDHLMTIE